MEDDTLDFGKSETVQTGVPGRETVTYEVVYENGAEVDSRVLDVARTAEPVPGGHPPGAPGCKAG